VQPFAVVEHLDVVGDRDVLAVMLVLVPLRSTGEGG
jgi:hypothetical protein